MLSEREQYEIYLNSQPENERVYETIIISHPAIETRYLVIDSLPLTAGLFTGGTAEFLPASIVSTDAANSNDLDQNATFTIADVDNELDAVLDQIPLDTDESPVIGYGIYHSDNLDAPVEFYEYEAKSIAQKKGVFTVKAGVPNLNSDQTGELFDLDRFPMLRGLF